MPSATLSALADGRTEEALAEIVEMLGLERGGLFACAAQGALVRLAGDAAVPAVAEDGESSLALHAHGRLVGVLTLEPALPDSTKDRELLRSAFALAAAATPVVADLHERQRIGQLVEGARLAAVGDLAAGIAHEINNPLFAILALTEFLLTEAEPESKARERLELIQETGLEIKEIIRALLDFARPRSGNGSAVVSLADVVRTTVDLFRKTSASRQLELVERYPAADDVRVEAAPAQLSQLVLHLLANARVAVADSGTVLIDVARERGYAVTRVHDDGAGVAAELRERIFEPFFTTRRADGGTGLGLTVARRIAELHGGTLELEDVPAGATFVLRLPIVEAE